MKRQAMTVALLTTVLGIAPALACKGKNILYEDDFSFADASWGDLPESVAIANGAMTLKVPASGANLFIRNIERYDKADICADVVMAGDASSVQFAGIAFLGDEGSSRYWD